MNNVLCINISNFDFFGKPVPGDIEIYSTCAEHIICCKGKNT